MTVLDRAVRLGLRFTGVRSRAVHTSQASHHVYDARGRGALPPVVFLPGLSDNATSQVPVFLRVRAGTRRVVVVEAGGHGLSGPAAPGYTVARHLASMTEALDAVLDEPAVLVGNSMGGATALHYARERPDRVRGLFLTSPAATPFDDDARADVRRAFTMRTAADAEAFISRVFHRRPALTRLLARVMIGRAGSSAVADILASMGDDHASPDELAAIAIPTTIVWGRSERLLPASGIDYLRAHASEHVSFVEPEGFGHCPHLDDPARLARDIVAFLESLGPG